MTKIFLWLIFAVFIPVTAFAAFPPAPVPQTGQTTCYDTTGATINCTNTGQDGELKVGWPWSNPRFTDNGDQTMTDMLTGLIWTKNANPAAGTKTWQGALDYIKSLNKDNYLGHSDWRLPNINEMKSLIDKGQTNQSTWLNTQGFYNVRADFYWSGSTVAYSPYVAWYVRMTAGYVGNYGKNSNFYVWPVRSSQSEIFGSSALSKTGQTTCYTASGATIICTNTGQDGELQVGWVGPNPRFVDTGDQTVADMLTGLIWSKNANPAAVSKNWQEALDYIKSLNSSNYLGHSDWRLPNVNELTSLLNVGQTNQATWLNTQGFTNVRASFYWSGSSIASDTSSAWYVGMFDAIVHSYSKASALDVWPVRSGQYWLIDSLIFSTSNSLGTTHVGAYSSTTSQALFVNRSSNEQTITTIAISGTDASEFSIATGGINPCSSLTPTIGAGTTCTLMLNFNPTSSGSKSALLDITTNGATKSIPLSGTAISTIYGVVTDQSTGQPVSEATVVLNTSATVTTGTDGVYTFDNLPAANYSITISKSGYQNITIDNLSVTTTTSTVANALLPTTGFFNMPSQTLTPANLTQAYAYHIKVTGGAHPYTFSRVSGTLPYGIILNTSNGELSGTPTAAGTYSFSIGVNDSAAGYAEAAVTLNVAEPFSISTMVLTSGEVASAYNITVAKTGGSGTITFTVINGSLPAGLKLNTSSGVISGTPTTAGISNFLITASDAFGRTDSKKYTIIIALQFTITTNRLNDALVGSAYSQTLAGINGQAPYNWEIVSGTLPTGLGLNASSGELSGTATTATSPSLTFGLRDATARLTTKTLTLNALNPIAVTTANLPNATIGSPYSQQVGMTGGLAPFNFTISGGILPNGLTLIGSTGVISGTATTQGFTNFGVTVTDSTWPIPQSVAKTMSIRTVTKAGDCDNSSTVTIAEVQSAINMFLGLKSTEVCVDQDGVGGVSIAEIQKVINSFLGL